MKIPDLSQLVSTKQIQETSFGKTAYWRYGKPDSKNKIIMLHGYRGDHHGLEPFAYALPDWDVYIPDLPGFGESTDLNVDHTIENLAAWLNNFRDLIDPEHKALILGHSFGTIISSFAFGHGMKAKHLVLINPIPQPALEGSDKFMNMITNAYFSFSGWVFEPLGSWLLKHPLMVQIMSSGLAKTKDKEVRKWIHAQHHEYFSNFDTRKKLLQSYRVSISNDVAKQAPNIDTPTLIIAGALDVIGPIPMQERLAGLFPDAKLIVLDEVGHLAHYEAFEEVATAIDNLVNN
ncbi:MAG: alpha/beta hydrolase [Microbacteriaceae bacterium]|nr:alpha/beta hydrolase [Microbacteriaceae bacterium]